MCNPNVLGALHQIGSAVSGSGSQAPAANPNAGVGTVVQDPATGRPSIQGFVAQQPSAMPTPTAGQPADQLRGAVGGLFGMPQR